MLILLTLPFNPGSFFPPKPTAEHHPSTLRDGIPTIDPDLGARDVPRRIAEEVDNRAHQVFRLAHLALRDE